jgi:hypothetical protein
VTISDLERHINLPSHLAEYDCGINEDIHAVIAGYRAMQTLLLDFLLDRPAGESAGIFRQRVKAAAKEVLDELKCKE